MGGSLGVGAVFSRASSGWYANASGTLVSAAINTPRFDYDPVTLQLKGLLLEDTSTNLALQSENLANAVWILAAGVVVAPTPTANQIASPNGTVTATRIVYPAVTGAGAYSFICQGITATAASYAFSVWLKGNAGGEQIYLGATNNVTWYSAPRITLTTQWQRFVFATPVLTAATWYPLIGTDLRDATQTSTPAQTIFAWGGQVELNFASSYIPTTTAAVTRAADVLSYPIASVTGFSTTQGSLAHEYIMEGTPLSYNGPIAFVGTDPNVDFILSDQGDAAGTSVARTINGVSISAAGTGVGAANWGPSLTVFRDVLQRGAMSWAINKNVNAAHNAIPHNFNSVGPPASLPMIVKLTLSGPVIYQYSMSQWARRTRYWPRQLSQSELISATTLDGPTLSLDFMTPGTLDPRIVFTRASTATYVNASGLVQSAAVNAPRWDYKAGVLQGLLIEEQRANVVAPSVNWAANQPANASQDGYTQNIGVSPSGASDAMALIPGSTNTVHQLFVGQQTGAINTTYTYSVYMKAAGIKLCRIGLENSSYPTYQSVVFDLSNGTVNSQAPNGSGQIQAVGNGWYRCSASNTSTSTVGAYIANIVPCDNTGNAVFAGNNVDGVWVWGNQVEAGAFPTSYIPTTSVSVTRAADVAVMPTDATKWYSSLNGTVLAEALLPPNGNVGYRGIFTLDGGPFNVWLRSYITSGTPNVDGNIDNSALAFGVMTPGTVFKSAATYSPAGSHCTLNGVMGVGSATVGTPSTWTTLRLGITDSANNNPANGYLRRLTYWNRALSDTEMQQVAT
jgi:hypothetical protein